VIATGGGALLRRENLEALRTRGLLIWLKADLNDLAHRVARGGAKRPMLKDTGQEERLQQLLTEREPVYAEADWSVDTTGKSVTDVVQTILHRIEGGGAMKQEGR
jgi:shikimate kinase